MKSASHLLLARLNIEQLIAEWEGQDAGPLTVGDLAVRLTVRDAARLAALCDLYPARGREALLLDGEKIGRLTSGGWSVHFGKQIGIGYVRPDLAEPGRKLKVRMFRELWDAEVVEESPYDPANATIRANG